VCGALTSGAHDEYAQRFADEYGAPDVVALRDRGESLRLATNITLGLAAAGWSVTVVEDAVSSRRAADRDAGSRRLAAAGVTVATVEMVMFEWLGRAGTDAFRDLLKLIK
jgi:hypothetical protein